MAKERLKRRIAEALAVDAVVGRALSEFILRESEARYRALVENAPEAIVVLDVDRNRFVDVNDNAVRLFGLPREDLLTTGPETVSPEFQSDGLLSAGLNRGYIERALKGGRPVFEWLHRTIASDGRCGDRAARRSWCRARARGCDRFTQGHH